MLARGRQHQTTAGHRALLLHTLTFVGVTFVTSTFTLTLSSHALILATVLSKCQEINEGKYVCPSIQCCFVADHFTVAAHSSCELSLVKCTESDTTCGLIII